MTQFTRRSFLKTSATLAAATAVFNDIPDFLKTERPIGIQLYSLRDDIKDGYLEDVLKGIAKIGYQFVEGYGYDPKKGKILDKSPSEFKKLLKENELKMPSSHFVVTTAHYDTAKKDFTDDFKKVVEASAAMSQRFLISPYTVDSDRKTGDDVKKLCEVLNKAGEYCKAQNIQFGYHNHEFEFKTEFGGVPMFDIMMENLVAENVTWELDLCWAVYGGRNTVELFQKYPSRFTLAHFKDLAEEGKRETAIVGEGVVDFEEILKNMRKGGIRQIIVELEDYKKSPMDDVKVSYKNLRKMLDKLEK
ncbi:MAG: sugar phosphate isomerase/epimerase [Saprospiraceae bacterium]|nr:sugar phosphate isomerase/epimerase [Saprospiraceae bacterium]